MKLSDAWWAAGPLLLAALSLAPVAWSHSPSPREEIAAGHGADGHGAHAAHGSAPGGEYVRRIESYHVPDVALVGRDGGQVLLASLLDTEKPVMLNFIFTSCTTICPVMTATFASVQKELGEGRDELQLVSISIDPQYDTPERLAAYAERQRAREPWQFLTGEPGSIRRVQEAFQAYRGDKMNHQPLTFMRASPRDPWVRIQGFATAADLVQEYRRLVGD